MHSFISTNQGVPYDFDSVMHYGSNAFSKNGKQTITPIDKNIASSRLGQRNGFSHNDILHVKALYCPGIGKKKIKGTGDLNNIIFYR